MSEERYRTDETARRRGRRRKRMTKEERKRQIAKRVAAVGGGIAAVTVIAAAIFWFRGGSSMPVARRNYGEYDIGNPTRQVERPELDVQLLTVNEYSRPGTPADQIRSVVVHYTANPGSTAQNNRDYFENLKDTQETKVSSNFIVGLEGEISSVCPPRKWHMRPIAGIMTVFRLNAAIRMRQESLRMLRISRWWSWWRFCVGNLIWGWMISSGTMMSQGRNAQNIS